MPSFRLPLNCVDINEPTSSVLRSSLPETTSYVREILRTELVKHRSFVRGEVVGSWVPWAHRRLIEDKLLFFYIFNILRANGKFELQRFKYLYVCSYYLKLLRALKFKFAVCTQATFSNASMFRSSRVRTVVPQFFRLSELWDFDEPTQSL